mgnify:CR=1 FL=1
MKILVIDIKASWIEYALYSVIPSPLYPLTGNPFGTGAFFKEIKKDSTSKNPGEVIEELKKTHRISYIMLGLPFYRFTHHIIELPLRKEREIKTAIAFELPQRLPLPIEEYVYDFTILKKKKDGTNLLSLSIRKHQLQEYLAPILETGIPVCGITCTFMTLISEISQKNRGRVIVAQEDGDFLYLAFLLGPEVKSLRLIRKGEDISYPFGFEDPSIPLYIIKTPSTPAEKDISRKGQEILLEPTSVLAKTLSKKNYLSFVPENITSGPKEIRPAIASYIIGASIVLFLLTDIIAYFKEKEALRRLRLSAESTREIKVRESPEDEEKRLLSLYGDSRNRLLRLLSRLSRIMPRDAVISSITIDLQDNILMLEGTASGSSKVLEALEQSGLFKNITYSGAITIKEGRENFKFRMEISGTR